MTNKKYNISFFKNFAKDKNGRCLSNEYKNVREKLLWKCEKEHQWSAASRKILEGSWCPQCAFERIRKYKIDHEFFSRDTEESFYIAGFLAADGWKIKANGGYRIGLSLSIKDLGFLEKIRKTLNIENPIKFGESICKISKYKTKTKYCRLIFCSKQIYKDLDRFSVFENKTYKIIFPEWLKKHPLVHHYMRGYIDGDGSYGYTKGKYSKNVSFAMRGTVSFLQSFHNILIDNGVVFEHYRRKPLTPKQGKKYPAFDRLVYGGNIIMSKFYDFMYKDANIYMDRKKDIIQSARGLISTERVKTGLSAKITEETFLKKAKELGSVEKMAEYYGCTAANISFHSKRLNIRNEINIAFGLYNTISRETLLKKFKELRTNTKVANYFGCTTTTISKLVTQYNLRKEINDYFHNDSLLEEKILYHAFNSNSIREIGRKMDLSNSRIRYKIKKLGLEEKVENILRR